MTARLTSAQIAAMYSAGDFDSGSFGFVMPRVLPSVRRDAIFNLTTSEKDTRVVLETTGALTLWVRGVLIATTPLLSTLPEAATYQNATAGDWCEARAWYKPVAAGARGYGLRFAVNGCFGYDMVGTPSGGALSSATSGHAKSFFQGGAPPTLECVLTNKVLGGSLAAHQIGRGVILGDSICSPRGTGGTNEKAVGSFIYTSSAEAQRDGYGILSLATPSQTAAQQLTVWQGHPARGSATVVWAILQVGYNDIQTLTAAQAITNIQNLVNDISANNPNAKIVVSKLTPALASSAPAVYTKLLAVNDAIAGLGGTPITGVHARVTSHFDAMKDGNGDLASAYSGTGGESYPNAVHPNNAGRAINAAAMRTALSSLGVL